MAQIRIHVLHCGKIGVAPNLPASAQWRWPAKADARRLKSGARIWLPVSAYLVEHPKGLFLVDAGLPRTVSPTGIEDRASQLRMFGRRVVHARAQRRGAGAVDRRATGRARHPAAGSGLCALFPPRPGSCRGHQRGAGRKASAGGGGGILLVVPREPALHLAQAVDGRATGAVLVPREPHRAGEPLVRPVWGRLGASRAHRRAHGGHVRHAHPQWRPGTCCSTPTARQVPAPGRRAPCPGICENSVRAKKALDWIGEMSRDGACAASCAATTRT